MKIRQAYSFVKRHCRLMLLLSALLPAGAFAQVGDARNDLAIGVSAGMVMNKISFEPSIEQRWHAGPTLGLTLRYTCEKYFATLCALQVELNYSKLGWDELILDGSSNPLPDRYARHQHYLQFPMFARLSWGREHRGLMGYFLVGPQVGYCFSEKTEQGSQWTLAADGKPLRPGGVVQQYGKPIENVVDYGIAAGAGVELNTAVGHFMLEGRYYYGLGDIYGNAKRDPFSRSANGTIFVKATYLVSLGKKK